MLRSSTLFLSDPDNQLLLRASLVAARCMEKWRSVTIQLLRSVDKIIPWLAKEITSGFAESIFQIWVPLTKARDLEYVGFEIPARFRMAAPSENTSYEIATDCERAEVLGSLLRNLCLERYKRCAFLLRDWGFRSALLLDPSTRGDTLALFKKGLRAWSPTIRSQRSRCRWSRGRRFRRHQYDSSCSL